MFRKQGKVSSLGNLEQLKEQIKEAKQRIEDQKMPKSLMKKEDMTIQEMEAKSQAWIDEDNAARKLDAPFSKEEIEKMDEQHAQDEMDRKMNEGYNRSRKSKGGSMLMPPEREGYMVGALIKGAARAAKNVKSKADKGLDSLSGVNKNTPGRTAEGRGVVVGKDRTQAFKTTEQIKGGVKGIGALLVGQQAYSALSSKEQGQLDVQTTESGASEERINPKDYPVYEQGSESAIAFRNSQITAKQNEQDVFEFEGRLYNIIEAEAKNMGGKMSYNKGGNVEEKEKLKNILQAGDDGADKAIVEIMKYIPGSEGPPKGLVDLLEPVLRKAGEMYRGDKKIKKAEGGSMLVPPEMEEDMPVDTYDNIPADEMAAAEASQLPDNEMEDGYLEFVLNESLETDDQEYLMSVLETDERLSSIFDKVMDVAGEFSGEGEVDGPGTGVSDSIPARLSDGEFVFTKKATDQMGADQLQTMMDEAEKAYDGGLMKKAFGGLTLDPMQDEKMMYGGEQMKSTQDDLRKQMLSANRMPSVLK